MSALESCIRRARRRYLSLLIFEQAAIAIALAMAGGILLLLLGTQILNWYWPVLLFGGSLAVGLYRTRNRIPSSYVLAQKIDRRLALHDTLATAVHFGHSSSLADQELVEAQRTRAERAACDVVVREAIPFQMPMAAYASVALLVITGTLFGVRYGMRQNLDLSQPMVSFTFDTFRVDDTVASARKRKTPEQQRLEEQLQGLSISPDQQNPQDFGEAPDSALNTVDTPDVNDFPQEALTKSQQKLSSSEVKAAGEEGLEQAGESGEESEGQSADPSAADGNNPEGAPQGKNASPQQGNQGENSSLMDKMRDALANLMQKMKMPQKPGGSQQTASSKPGQQNSQQQSMSEKGTPQPGSRQQGDSQTSDADGDQQGEGGEQADNGQSKQGSQGADQQASKDAKSGMGKQDGDKDVQLAEQLEAMGKISEIFGKRAQNLTGEVMVEVAAGKQQLRTQYSQKAASHSDSGGEIHRDEIPLVYQHYVQQYFEQIRNSTAAKGANSEKKAPAVPETKPMPREGLPAQARP
jgi:hypothetical protein